MITKAFTHGIPVLILLLAGGCRGTGPVVAGAGTPKWDPSDSASFTGSSATPPHNLPPSEYPFDAAGNYLPDVARAGSGGSVRDETSSPPSRKSSSAAASAPARKSAGSRTHRITAGDTLSGLARKYGVSVPALKKANGMSSDKLVTGRTVRIP